LIKIPQLQTKAMTYLLHLHKEYLKEIYPFLKMQSQSNLFLNQLKSKSN
jgi:hypothetical protein